MSRLKELRTPVFWTEGHPGELNRETWGIEVSGLCANPKTFTWPELTALPKSIAHARLTSVTRFSVRGRWGGVKVADLFDEVQCYGLQIQCSLRSKTVDRKADRLTFREGVLLPHAWFKNKALSESEEVGEHDRKTSGISERR